ncbi:MAG: hypothetical protein RIG82_12335 [Phycisphaeraceae bacterium]
MNSRITTSALLGAALVAATSANAQVIYNFSDSASDWTHLSGEVDGGTGVAIFDLDYSDFQRYADVGAYGVNAADLGDGFRYTLPASPNGGGSTTGILISANDDSLNANFGTGPALSALFGTGAPMVGTGTANPNYVFKFDMLHATGDDDRFTGTFTGTTNVAGGGINFTSTTDVRVRGQQIGTPTTTNQGQSLVSTADSGSSIDWAPNYGGFWVAPRFDFETDINGDVVQENRSGLAASYVEMTTVVDIRTLYPGNANIQAVADPILGSSVSGPRVSTLSDGAISDHGYSAKLRNAFPSTGFNSNQAGVPGAGITYTGTVTGGFADPGGSQTVTGGGWNTHEIYYVDGDITYVIDGTVVLFQEDVANYTTQEGTDQTSSGAGYPMVAFQDPFLGSLAASPEGANFAIIDNAILEVATSAPSFNAARIRADFNFDGVANGTDVDLLVNEILTNPTGTIGYLNADWDRWLTYDIVRVWDSELTGIPLADPATENEIFVLDEVDLDYLIEGVLGTVYGDANLDGAVDLIDLSALATNFGLSGGWGEGNFNPLSDGVVDLIDLSTLASNFGFVAAVPEPAGAALVGLGALAALRRSRK